VALAHHYREFEGLTIQQIADRLGRAPATVKAYFYDPSDANKGPTNLSKAGGRELRSHARAAAPRENFVSDGPFLWLGAAVQHLR
jgi:hypothetical protein